jgi:hypothetical protein
MTRRSRAHGLGLLLCAVMLAGCPGPTFVVQQYAGAVRPQEEIATLRVNGSDSVRLVTLDGEDVRAPLEVDSRLHIELLPGRHRLGVAQGTADAVAAEVELVAEAGKVYRVTFVGAAPHVLEVNRSSDAAGADVTAAPAAPARAPSPAPAAPAAPSPSPSSAPASETP